MERARQELHAEALRNKEAKENKIKECCPNLPDLSTMAEGRNPFTCLRGFFVLTYHIILQNTLSTCTLNICTPESFQAGVASEKLEKACVLNEISIYIYSK